MNLTINDLYVLQPQQSLESWKNEFDGAAIFEVHENIVCAVVDMMGRPTNMGEYDTITSQCTLCC